MTDILFKKMAGKIDNRGEITDDSNLLVINDTTNVSVMTIDLFMLLDLIATGSTK